MEHISGPSEALSSEFRLQQKRLNRELDTVIVTLTSLQQKYAEDYSSSSSSSDIHRDEWKSILESLENKIEYLISKEKETSFKAEEHLRKCNVRIEYFARNNPMDKDVMTSMETDTASAALSDDKGKRKFPRDSELDIRNFVAHSNMINCGDYLLRKGYADIVHDLVREDSWLWNKETSHSCLGDFLEHEQFKSSLLVEAALRENDMENGDGALQLALGWCSQHGSRLRRLLSPLEFCLRVEQFITLAQSGRKSQAFTHIQEYLIPLSQEAIARMNDSELSGGNAGNDHSESGDLSGNIGDNRRARSGTETSAFDDDPPFTFARQDSNTPSSNIGSTPVRSSYQSRQTSGLNIDTSEDEHTLDRSATDPPRRLRTRSDGGSGQTSTLDSGYAGAERRSLTTSPLVYLASAAYAAANRVTRGSPNRPNRQNVRNRSNSTNTATTRLAHRAESPPTGAWRISRELEPTSSPPISSSIWSIPRFFTSYFSSSNISAGGDDSNSSILNELNALSSFERLLLCATSLSNASSTNGQDVPSALEWCKFQSLLIEECLSELSSLLVLTLSSRTMKQFYGTSHSIVEDRRRKIADLYKSEAVRVFRLSWKPNLVTSVQLGAIAFKASCPAVNQHPQYNQENPSSGNSIFLGALGAVENTRRQMWQWMHASLGGVKTTSNVDLERNVNGSHDSVSSGTAHPNTSSSSSASNKQTRSPRSPRGKHRGENSNEDENNPTATNKKSRCDKCEYMYQPIAPPDEAYKVMRNKYCAECNAIGVVSNQLENCQICPLCIPSVTAVAKGVPVPSRIATTLRCRGTGERITEKSGRNIPMALPNGHVFSKKYIYDNSYLKLSMPGEHEASKKFREDGFSLKELLRIKQLKEKKKAKKERRASKKKEKREREERRREELKKMEEEEGDEEPLDGRQFFDEEMLDDYPIEEMMREYMSDFPRYNPFEELEEGLSSDSSDSEKEVDKDAAEEDDDMKIQQELSSISLDELQKDTDYSNLTTAGIPIPRWMENPEVYFNCPITGTAYTLNTIRQLYIA